MSAAAPAQGKRSGAWLASAAMLGVAALFVAATVAWSGMTVVPREARSRAAGAALLDHAAAAERDWALEHGSYAVIEPDGMLRGATPHGPRPVPVVLATGDFQLDASMQANGGLRLRVISRLEAISAGRQFPVLLATVLPPAGANARASR